MPIILLLLSCLGVVRGQTWAYVSKFDCSNDGCKAKYSPDGSRILVFEDDRANCNISVFDSNTYQLILSRSITGRKCYDGVYSKDQKWVGISLDNRTVLILHSTSLLTSRTFDTEFNNDIP